MNLKYRGVGYVPSVMAVPVVETGETGTFLGKPYTLKQPQVALRQAPTELVYRGVRYSR
jgi:hypothetical protein